MVDIFNQQAGDSCAAKTIVVVHDSMPGADRISALEALGSGVCLNFATNVAHVSMQVALAVFRLVYNNI